MLGFGRTLLLIGTVTHTIGKTTEKHCGKNLVKKLSIKQQNSIGDETIELVSNIRKNRITEVNDKNYDDLMIVGFLLLAREYGNRDESKHREVLFGMVSFLTAAMKQSSHISAEILEKAHNHINRYRDLIK